MQEAGAHEHVNEAETLARVQAALVTVLASVAIPAGVHLATVATPAAAVTGAGTAARTVGGDEAVENETHQVEPRRPQTELRESCADKGHYLPLAPC